MKYKKDITLLYKYVSSLESDKALSEVFDEIFTRLATKRGRKMYASFSYSTAVLFSLVLEHRENYILTIN